MNIYPTMTPYMYKEFQDLQTKYDHLWKFMHEILGILKEMEARNIKDKEMKERKVDVKCKFYNRGSCIQGNSCRFLHPLENCKEHVKGKKCSQENKCNQRHPNRCRYWLQGGCFTMPQTVKTDIFLRLLGVKSPLIPIRKKMSASQIPVRKKMSAS